MKVPLRVFRFRPGERPRYDSFTVEVSADAYVIDAIDAVWSYHDPTLMFRRACHHSSCGSCAIRINGAERLPCIVRVSQARSGKAPLLLEPLQNFPLIGDLAVDVGEQFQRLAAADMSMTCEAEAFLPFTVDSFAVNTIEPKVVELPETISAFSRFEQCIECGICVSACPTMATDNRFWGPAALAAVYQARQKSTDPQRVAQLLGLVDGEHGVWRCHSAFECTESCPQAVDPAGKIMALRRELTARRFGRQNGK